nr:MAG TPA: ECF sigma factor [Caudoviricetes sp.]
MDKQHRAIRAQLSSMAPRRAIAYIQAYDLPPDEMACLIECDVRRKSYAQVCESLHLSPEAVNRCRRRAYKKIADGQREHRG